MGAKKLLKGTVQDLLDHKNSLTHRNASLTQHLSTTCRGSGRKAMHYSMGAAGTDSVSDRVSGKTQKQQGDNRRHLKPLTSTTSPAFNTKLQVKLRARKAELEA